MGVVGAGKLLLAGYVTVASLLYLFQQQSVSTTSHNLPQGVSLEMLTRDDGEDFRVLIGKPRARRLPVQGVAVFFGGNGEHLDALVYRCLQFAEYGLEVIAPEPPGYGASPGPVSKETFLHVAEVVGALAQERAQELEVPIFAIGSSLGTFSAVHLATSGLVSRVVLHAPLTSLVDVAASIYWFMPVRRLLSEAFRFDNELSLLQQRAHLPPALVLHGLADSIVPFSSGKRIFDLFRAGNPGSQFIVDERANHNDLSLSLNGPHGKTIRRFLFGKKKKKKKSEKSETDRETEEQD